MYYKTFYKPEYNTNMQYTIDMLYNGVTPNNVVITGPPEKMTIRKDTAFTTINTALVNMLETNLHLMNNIPFEYEEYNIPKSSGGYRRICAPNAQLKELQRNVADNLTRLGAIAHNAAYAYVPSRTCKDALIKHQSAENKWFYKFDIKDFFPSCNTEVLPILKYVYPFCALSEDTLSKIIELATYKGALPQGSPLSPLLSNMILTVFDFKMQFSVKAFNGVYTRYADDILISTPTHHELSFIQHIIKKHLESLSSNFKINTDKSRCGSIKGSNWNLGLILNAENKITLGHDKKMKLKAKINNFIFDFTNQKYWSIIDTQVLQGEVNYFKTIEPEYAAFVIYRLEQKYKQQTRHTLAEMFSAIISGKVCN